MKKNLKKNRVLVSMSADVIHHGHINIINEARKYGDVTIGLVADEIVAKHKEQKAVEVFVATEPSEDTTKSIKTKLVSAYGEGTNIEFKIDPNIMGGLSLKVGDETLDLSVKGKVKKLINQLNF